MRRLAIHPKRQFLLVLAVLFSSLLVAPIAFAAGGYTWTNTTTGTAMSGESWGSVASSESGKYLVAADTSGGDLYISSDYGATWIDRTAGTSAGNQVWGNKDLSMSASGQYITAMNVNGDVWNSNDYGATWTNRTAGTSLSGQNWQQSATSSTGQYVVVTDYNSDIFVSSDYGAHWKNETVHTTLTGLSWNNVSISASGRYMYVLADNAGMYGSTNYGATWTKLAGEPSQTSLGWYDISTSANGQRVVAADYEGDLYTSNDHGVHWIDRTVGTPLSGLNWRGLASSGSGQFIVAMSNDYSGSNPTYVYSSRDYGVTWTNLTPSAPLNTVYWESIALSASGQHIVAGANDVYTADDPSLAPAKPALKKQTATVDANGSVTVNVLSGVSGVDPSTLSIVSGPHHGKAVDPPGTITYTPASGYTGTDSLTYQVCAQYDDTVCAQGKLVFTVATTTAPPDTGFGRPAKAGPTLAVSVGSFAAMAFGLALAAHRGRRRFCIKNLTEKSARC